VISVGEVNFAQPDFAAITQLVHLPGFSAQYVSQMVSRIARKYRAVGVKGIDKKSPSHLRAPRSIVLTRKCL
jgi:hypothetical protein